MNPTTHAQVRMQQRGIPADWVTLLSCFGMEVESERGVDRLALPRREAEQLRRRIEALLQRWDHLVGAYAVVSHTDAVITAAHTTGRPRRRARPNTRFKGDPS